MRRRTILIAALVTAALVCISSVLVVNFGLQADTKTNFSKSISRNAEGTAEENALSAAENADYAAVFNTTRFSGWGSGSDVGDPSDYQNRAYPEYTYANFIDAGTIDYYNARFDWLKAQNRKMEYNYTANVYRWSQIRFFNGPPVGNQSIYNTKIVISSPDGAVRFENTEPNRGMDFAFRNGSKYQILNAGEVDLEFSNCYVVEMKLSYAEIYGSLAAFFSDVYQIVVVDQNFTPVLLCLQSQKVIS